MGARTFSFIRHGAAPRPTRSDACERPPTRVVVGEAAHNPLISAGKKAEGRAILDPALTATGRAQAVALAEDLAQPQKQFDIVVTSPLTRALETAAAIYATQESARVVVTALHTENGIPVPGDPVAGNPCQRGAAADDLAARYASPDWDFSAVRDPRAWATDGAGWFSPLRADDRIPLFRAFLGSLPPDKDVLVVGHSGFWKKLFGQDQIMANCEVLTRGLDG